MDRRHFHDLLEQLHRELQRSDATHRPEDRELLQTLREDLRRALGSAGPAGPAGPAPETMPEADAARIIGATETPEASLVGGEGPVESPQGLRERLDTAVIELEEEHPQLVASMRGVIQYLSGTGI